MYNPMTLNYEIRSEVSHFINSERGSRNKSTLADKVGLSRVTLNNFLNGEVDPSPKTVFKLLKFFRGHEEATELMKELYPSWYNYNGKSFIEGESVHSNSYDFSFNIIHSNIFEMAQLSSGVTEKWVKENFGSKVGIPALNELLKGGFITKINNLYKAPKEFSDENTRRLVEQVKADCERFPIDEFRKTAFILKSDDLVCSSVRKIAIKAISDCFSIINNAKQDEAYANEPKDEFLKISLLGNWIQDESENDI